VPGDPGTPGDPADDPGGAGPGVGLAGQAAVSCREPGEREALGIGEHRLGGDRGSCEHISADSQVNLYEPVDAE
jgi:hypothetical protein